MQSAGNAISSSSETTRQKANVTTYSLVSNVTTYSLVFSPISATDIGIGATDIRTSFIRAYFTSCQTSNELYSRLFY